MICCPSCGRTLQDATQALRRLSVPTGHAAFIPADVARERLVLPWNDDADGVSFLTDVFQLSDRDDLVDFLRFVLNRKIVLVHGNEDDVRHAIERTYDGG
jgi:hypothetical protein